MKFWFLRKEGQRFKEIILIFKYSKRKRVWIYKTRKMGKRERWKEKRKRA